MSWEREFDNPDPAPAPAPTPAPTPAAPLMPTMEFLGIDPDGKDVYRGSDGKMYTGDPSGMNGFGPYTGPGVTPPTAPGPQAPPPTQPPPPVLGGGRPGPLPPNTGPGPLDPFVPQYPPVRPFTPPLPPPRNDVADYTPPPAYVAPPAYTAGQITKPPAFSHADFVGPEKFRAPTADEVFQDPSYRLRRDEGQQGIENSAAARGMTRSGMNLKDIAKYNQAFASSEYGNIYDRRAGEWDRDFGAKFQEYSTNYGKAADTYATNWGVDRDSFALNEGALSDAYKTNAGIGRDAYTINRDTGEGAWDRLFTAGTAKDARDLDIWKTSTSTGQRQNEIDWDRDWSKFLMDYEIFKRNQDAPFDKLGRERDAYWRYQ
jgi:hypothetical protein